MRAIASAPFHAAACKQDAKQTKQWKAKQAIHHLSIKNNVSELLSLIMMSWFSFKIDQMVKNAGEYILAFEY